MPGGWGMFSADGHFNKLRGRTGRRETMAARAGTEEGERVDEETPAGAAARLLAVEVLLAEPEALGDDVLESCLYILRDRLTGTAGEED
jgi:hypothetical protein